MRFHRNWIPSDSKLSRRNLRDKQIDGKSWFWKRFWKTKRAKIIRFERSFLKLYAWTRVYRARIGGKATEWFSRRYRCLASDLRSETRSTLIFKKQRLRFMELAGKPGFLLNQDPPPDETTGQSRTWFDTRELYPSLDLLGDASIPSSIGDTGIKTAARQKRKEKGKKRVTDRDTREGLKGQTNMVRDEDETEEESVSEREREMEQARKKISSFSSLAFWSTIVESARAKVKRREREEKETERERERESGREVRG